MDLRHEGDYQDFAEVTKEETNGSVKISKRTIKALKKNFGKSFIRLVRFNN